MRKLRAGIFVAVFAALVGLIAGAVIPPADAGAAVRPAPSPIAALGVPPRIKPRLVAAESLGHSRLSLFEYVVSTRVESCGIKRGQCVCMFETTTHPEPGEMDWADCQAKGALCDAEPCSANGEPGALWWLMGSRDAEGITGAVVSRVVVQRVGDEPPVTLDVSKSGGFLWVCAPKSCGCEITAVSAYDAHGKAIDKESLLDPTTGKPYGCENLGG